MKTPVLPIARRTFLASLFAPLMPWRKPKVPNSRNHRVIVELPEPVTCVFSHLHEIYTFAGNRAYRIFPDGTYEKLERIDAYRPVLQWNRIPTFIQQA